MASGNSVQNAIVAFLKGKGLSGPAIAGILGNLQVESGFRTDAFNANENAIGLAQWEGGRRTALQAYARSQGKPETDLGVQLNYMWQELNGSHSGALNALKGARNAADAASIWDQQFEGSAGTTRGQRIGFANQFAANGFAGIAASSSPSGGGSGGGGSFGGVMTAGGTPGDAPGMSAADYKAALSGDLVGLLTSVPELKHLLDSAIAKNQPINDFVNSIQNSKFYKTHADSVRAIMAQKASDPATYNQKLNQTAQNVVNLSKQLGMPVTSARARAIALSGLTEGQDGNTAWLTQHIGLAQNYDHVTNNNKLTGGMAATVQQLQQLAGAYGQKWSAQTLQQRAYQVLTGGTTIDTYKQLLLTQAKSMFPGLNEQLDHGLTVTDAANPYISSMSNLLEMDPASVDINTPMVRRALQGMGGSVGAVGAATKSSPTLTPLWQFEQQVKQDPRWGFTKNAHQDMASLTMQLGRSFGFET